ncbi:MAG: hypothetical protein ABMA25_00845 [Ilumatobacteraceae bacterium]
MPRPNRADIGDLPPELTGGLTFHLPMELAALTDAGADRRTLAARTTERMTEAYAAGMIDPPLYRWAVDRYRPVAAALLSPAADVRAAAFTEIEPLGEGLAGAAFHGLIRLGYAAWHRDAEELARGLAYLRTRRQVLAAPSRGVAAVVRPGDLPSVRQQEGATVFDMLNRVAGTGVPGQSAGGRRPPTPRALATEAAGLVRRNPSSFVAVHAFTGLHALCEVHALLTGQPPANDAVRTPGIGSWWSTIATAIRACSVLIEHTPPEALAAYDGQYGDVDSVDSLVAASTRSGETHDVKLAVSLRRMVTMGVVSADDAVSVGLHRLAAGQLL